MKLPLQSGVAKAILVVTLVYGVSQTQQIVQGLEQARRYRSDMGVSVMMSLGVGFQYLADPIFLFCSAIMIEYLHRIWVALSARNAAEEAAK